MGAGSSQHVPCYPTVDYRLFHQLATVKSGNSYTICIPPSSTADEPPRFRAIVHPSNKKKSSEGADIELFEVDDDAKDGLGPCIGVIKSTTDGLRFALGDIEEQDIRYEGMADVSRKKPPLQAFEFSFIPTESDGLEDVRKAKQAYSWQIVRYSGMGKVSQMLLRVKPEVEPEPGDEKTEEKGGEIVAIWKKKGWLKGGEGFFWFKTGWKQSMGKEGAREWERNIILTGLALLEGWWN